MRKMMTNAKEIDPPEVRKRYYVFMFKHEHDIVEAKAKMVRHTFSSYLRSLGMGYSPPSRVDNDRVIELMSVNADLARLGNLLKLWLADDEKARGFSREQIQSLLDVLIDTATTLRQKSRKILKD